MASRWTWGPAVKTPGWVMACHDGTPSYSDRQLNGAYTYGSAGAAAGWCFSLPADATLTDIYFRVVSYSGTWGSTDGNVNWYVYEGQANSRIPGSTVVASGTFALNGSTTGWFDISGLSVSLTGGKKYYIVIADADGGATNYCTIRYATNNNGSGYPFGAECLTTTNGWTGSSVIGAAPMLGIKAGGAVYAGLVWEGMNTIGSSTNPRGVRFKLKERATLVGSCYNTDDCSVGTPTHKLFGDSQVPSDTPLLSYACPSFTNNGTAPTITGVGFPSPIDLEADTWYRLVVVPSSASTTPRKIFTGSNCPSELLAASQYFGNCHHTEWNGSAWVDSTDATSNFGPMLFPHTDPAFAGALALGRGLG